MQLLCQCGNRLGRIADGVYLITHKGREIAAEGVRSITCEDCKRIHRLSRPLESDRILAAVRALLAGQVRDVA